MYFSYHNVIKNKIKKEMLVKVEYLENYKDKGRVMLLYFNDGKKYFIREYAWSLYKDLIK
jgi:hypothetical protein